ncbi:MAG: hypothetical protein WCO56_16355 [Verrucomicrobiota bacterium]
MNWFRFSFLLLAAGTVYAAPLPDLGSLKPDLVIPELREGKPAPGHRVRQTLPGYAGTRVYHVLYLPEDWQPGRRYPVIAEYAGNGGYTNRYGDISLGWPENSRLGYGLSGGRGCLWICLPYIVGRGNERANTNRWWGDIAETVGYCQAAMRWLAAEYGADTNRLVLAGFSRGAIGCNVLGLHDEETSWLWRAFFAHSHYDGVNTNWPYQGADRASALERLQRLRGRPQWISQEGGVKATEDYLRTIKIPGDFTFVPLPFRNHTDAWVLYDLPERRQAREWLARVMQMP